MLNSDDNKSIHQALMNVNMKEKDDDDQYPDMNILYLYNYLGTIELGALMLQKDIISFDDFFNQFGYRVQSIFNSKKVISIVERDKEFYSALLYVKEQMIKHNKLR